MTKSKLKISIAILLAVLAVVSAVVGFVNLPKRTSEIGEDIISDLRIKTIINATTGDGLIETYIELAKEEARVKAKEAKLKMAEQRKVIAEAEEATRAKYEGVDTDNSSINPDDLAEPVKAYAEKLKAYLDEEAAARQEYYDAHYDEAEAKAQAEREAKIAEGKDVPETMKVVVDMSGFVATEKMNALRAVSDEAYAQMGDAFKKSYPLIDDQALEAFEESIEKIVYVAGDDFSDLYDRYNAAGSMNAVDNKTAAFMVRYADDFIYIAIALVIAVLTILFSEFLIAKFGIPRVIIGLFFILLCFVSLFYDLPLDTYFSNTLVRMGMNSIMVLAMVPGIQCGISLNLGLPIGLVAGLFGGLATIQLGIPGFWGFLFAILVGGVIAAIAGWMYGHLLNRLKGEEMGVTTYVGFSIVSLMCIVWLVLPFNSLKLRWPLGSGMRNTIGLDKTNFEHVLDDFLAFEIGGFTVPTGLLLFMAALCFLVWLFGRSKTGIAMQAVGNNPRFAEATGISVNKMRIIGTVISTVLGAIGILVYSQSYGFMQLYTAPRQMGFIAASAILIGGASTSRCKVSHVLIGTFLFQGVLTLGMPVANVIVPGSTFSETLRILISNGIILYALTKSGGATRG